MIEVKLQPETLTILKIIFIIVQDYSKVCFLDINFDYLF